MHTLPYSLSAIERSRQAPSLMSPINDAGILPRADVGLRRGRSGTAGVAVGVHRKMDYA